MFLIQVILFVTSLEASHSRLGESIPVSHQNSQTIKKIEADILIFLDCSVLYRQIVKR